MKCLNCHHSTKVLESRLLEDKNIIRRRRQCLHCSHRLTTYEKIQTPQLLVSKNDGSVESFKFDKLFDGIWRATKKTKMDKLQTEKLARLIEKEILALNKSPLKSQKIGEIVIKHLAVCNKVAYLRFVSVYRRLKTLASFEREISFIKK